MIVGSVAWAMLGGRPFGEVFWGVLAADLVLVLFGVVKPNLWSAFYAHAEPLASLRTPSEHLSVA